MTPTLEIYTALQTAFDHFNDKLFDRKLPQCLITLRSSSRAYGYMHKDRFVSVDGQRIDELGINPGYFALQSIEEVMATVVHEMVHHWQNHFGTPSESMPHNREWADKMEAVGLMPSDTGLPGGKRTGRSMNDFILPDGPFIRACAELKTKGICLPWLDSRLPVAPEVVASKREELAISGQAYVSEVREEVPIERAAVTGVKLDVAPPAPRTSAAALRIRQVCPTCKAKAWTGPEVSLSCGDCHVPMSEG
ncbi:MAG: SprT-like domain-containing protein [Rhodocyclaceae bacterium]